MSIAMRDDLQPAPRESRAAPNMMFESVATDLHWAAVHVATMASLFNAQARIDLTGGVRNWRQLLAQDVQAMLLLLRFHDDFALPQPVARSLATLYEHLASVNAATLTFCETHPRAATGRTHAEQLTHSWRRLAAEAAQVLRALEPLESRMLSELFVADARMLADFLEETAKGSAARVAPSGEVNVPPVNQNRRSPRVAAHGRCRASLDGASYSAELIDASREGIGLHCAVSLPVGKRVHLELPDGRQIAGAVVRCDSGRVGLRLERRLPLSDPLLAGV